MAPERHLTRWDFWILRIIAVYHLFKSAFFFALGFALLHFLHHSIEDFLNGDFVNDYVKAPLGFDADNPYLKWLLEKAADIKPHTLRFLGYLFFSYGLIFAVEGVGLYLRKRWAEYMVVIVVTSLVPFELYEIHHKFAWWKIGLMVGNLLVIAFLARQIVVGSSEHKKQ